MSERPTTTLRRLLAGPEFLIVPGVADSLNARLVAEEEFKAIYMTGAGTTAVRLGMPDVGLLTMDEMVDNASRIAEASGLPLIADADTGYGGPLNVMRTIRAYERAGVAGVHIEDQHLPKRCGHFAGKTLVPAAEMAAKIRAAVDAREDPDFLIIARSDALAVNGWDDTIRRCRAYHEAGADMVFVDGVKSTEDLERYARDLADAPRLYNGDLVSTQEIERLGFKIMIHRGSMFAVYKWVRSVMEQLKCEGVVDPSLYGKREEVAGLLGLDAIYEMEKEYAVAGKS